LDAGALMNEQYAITFETIIRVKELSLSKQDRTEEIQDLLTARPFDYNALKAQERERVLGEVFSSMDIFFGDIPMDSNIIKWAVSKQDSFVTAAMACYLHSRKLRSESRECPR